MSYNPTVWENDVTPLSAENLNKIENEIKNIGDKQNSSFTIYKDFTKIGITDTSTTVFNIYKKLPNDSCFFAGTSVDGKIKGLPSPYTNGEYGYLMIFKTSETAYHIQWRKSYNNGSSGNSSDNNMYTGICGNNGIYWDTYCRLATVENKIATAKNELTTKITEVNNKVSVNTDWIDLKKSPYIDETTCFTITRARCKVVNNICYLRVSANINYPSGGEVWDRHILKNLPYVPSGITGNERFEFPLPICTSGNTSFYILENGYLNFGYLTTGNHGKAFAINVSYPIKLTTTANTSVSVSSANSANMSVEMVGVIENNEDVEDVENTEIENTENVDVDTEELNNTDETKDTE